jgi:hypothetical protein
MQNLTEIQGNSIIPCLEFPEAIYSVMSERENNYKHGRVFHPVFVELCIGNVVYVWTLVKNE